MSTVDTEKVKEAAKALAEASQQRQAQDQAVEEAYRRGVFDLLAQAAPNEAGEDGV